MKVEVKKLDKLKRVIKVEVSGEEFFLKKKEVYQQVGKNLKVPGFRTGSAPLDILEKYHSKYLREEFIKEVIPFYYNKSIEQENLNPATLPKIYNIDLSNDKIEFCAEFEVRPSLDLSENNYKGIVIKDEKVQVTEIEIEKAITNLKEYIKKLTNQDFTDQMIAKWASYATVEDLKEAIKTEILSVKLKKRLENIRNKIINHLLDSIKFELPKAEVDAMHRQLLEEQLYSLKLQNVSSDDLEKYKKDLEEKLKPIAEQQVKLSYILDAIAQRENIKVENDLSVVINFILSQAVYK